MASNDGIAGSKPKDDAGGGLAGMSRRAGVQWLGHRFCF